MGKSGQGRLVHVAVADHRGFIADRFPFQSLADAERYVNAVRSHGVRAWIDDAETVHVAEKDTSP